MAKIVWDEDRFPGHIYAVVNGTTVASIVERGSQFDVFPAPDARPHFHGVDGITMDSFLTLEAAKSWVEEFVG